jgi:hypothetical protein
MQAWGLGTGLTTLHRRKSVDHEIYKHILVGLEALIGDLLGYDTV